MISGLKAQVTVAISTFQNETGQYYLDSWEKTIPDMLKSELSVEKNIIVLERQTMEDVLREQALSMTGLVDTATAQKVGKLLGAQYVINGTISRSGEKVRIDAKIIRVETGQLHSEKATAQNNDHLDEMIQLLGNNIRYMLSGKGSYKNEIKIKQYPTLYFLGATLILGGTALWMNSSYHDSYDAYHTSTSLNEFDKQYDDANRYYKIRNALYGVTGAALIGTVYCLIQNISPEKVLAQNKRIIPGGYCDRNGRYYAGIKILF